MGWFNSLSALEKTYFIIACVASVFLIIQILFMVFGGDGDADADGDIDGDGASDGGGDSGVTPFSVKGIVAFFAVGGWTGLLTTCTWRYPSSYRSSREARRSSRFGSFSVPF